MKMFLLKEFLYQNLLHSLNNDLVLLTDIFLKDTSCLFIGHPTFAVYFTFKDKFITEYASIAVHS